MSNEKTYLIEFENGKRQKITVPDDWKVTFGPAARGINKGSGVSRHQMPLALRFYESATKQRAIFTDVVSFRDVSIKIEEERVNTQTKDGFIECDGARKATTFQATSKEWVNPDEPNENIPLLPSDESMFDCERLTFDE